MAKTKHVLNVKLRSEGGSANARRLRREGLIPAVIYGCGTESKSVSVCAQEWEMLSRGELNMLTLKLEDGTETLALAGNGVFFGGGVPTFAGPEFLCPRLCSLPGSFPLMPKLGYSALLPSSRSMIWTKIACSG